MIVDAAIGLIAFVALGISIWQGWLMRQQARLSVRPCLDFAWSDGGFDGRGACLRLHNAGLGPALIYDLHIGTDSQPMKQAGEEIWGRIMNGLGIGRTKFYQVLQQTVVRPGGSLDIMQADLESSEKAAQVGKRVRATVSYKSLYDEPFEASFQGS